MAGLLAGTLLGAASARAAATQFKVATGNWSDPANWSAGLPTTNEADIGSNSQNPATASINPGDTLTSGKLVLGQWAGQTGTVNQTGGLLDLGTNILYLAANNSSSYATYTLSGGVLTNALLFVTGSGSGNTGTLYLSGGTLYGTPGTVQSPTVGQGAGSLGRVVQTSGAYINATNKDLTIGRDGAVGVYDLSGGVLTNSGTITLGMNASGAAPVGTLLLGGTGSVYCASKMYLGYGSGGPGTGIVVQTAGLCQPAGGLKIGGYAKSVGRYEISGGQLVASVDVAAANPSSGTLVISSNAAIRAGWLSVGSAWGATGSVAQSGGTVYLSGALTVGSGYSGGCSGTYTMTGGLLTNVSTITVGGGGARGMLSLASTATVVMASGGSDYYLKVAADASSTGLLQIVGAHVRIAGVTNFDHNQPGSMLDLLFESDGISKLSAGWNAYLGGTLSMGIKGGLALFQTNAFTFLQTSAINGDFAAKATSVFTAATNGTTRYVATLDAAQRVAAGTLSRGGQVLAFTPVSRGWFATAVSTNRGTAFDLALNVTTVGATPAAELDDLVAYLGQSGFTIRRTGFGWDGPNVLVTLPTVAEGVTNTLAWDLGRFDTDLRVAAVTIPARGTLVTIQ